MVDPDLPRFPTPFVPENPPGNFVPPGAASLASVSSQATGQALPAQTDGGRASIGAVAQARPGAFIGALADAGGQFSSDAINAMREAFGEEFVSALLPQAEPIPGNIPAPQQDLLALPAAPSPELGGQKFNFRNLQNLLPSEAQTLGVELSERGQDPRDFLEQSRRARPAGVARASASRLLNPR